MNSNSDIITTLDHVATDLDLPPIRRAEANYWRAQYWQTRADLVNANKGLRRLQSKLRRLQQAQPPRVHKTREEWTREAGQATA